jgi:hypothetical protein
MTDKLKEVLADPKYKDPKLFTKTCYDERGYLLDDPPGMEVKQHEYIPLDTLIELLDGGTPEGYKKLAPFDWFTRTIAERGEWADKYNWKTRAPREFEEDS